MIALSMHVNYWDYIGWKDPFASAASTKRQRDYAATLGKRMVYTPQVVIDGRIDAVGSARGDIERKLKQADAKLPLAVGSPEPGRLEIALPAGAPGKPASVWLLLGDAEHETRVGRGENSGVTLRNYNVVRDLRLIGEWTGAAERLSVELDPEALAGRDFCAVIVQEAPVGPVIAAAIMDVSTP